MQFDTFIRADLAAEKSEHPASHYAQRVFRTLEYLGGAYDATTPWRHIPSDQHVVNSQDVAETLAAGVNRTDTTREAITALGFRAAYACGDLTAEFHVGATSPVSKGTALVDPPLDAPQMLLPQAQSLIHFLASTWGPDSVAWTNIGLLRLNRDLGYEPDPAPGALTWINESAQDPFVDGEPMLNGTLHRLADRPPDVTAEILHAAHGETVAPHICRDRPESTSKLLKAHQASGGRGRLRLE